MYLCYVKGTLPNVNRLRYTTTQPNREPAVYKQLTHTQPTQDQTK